MAFLMLYTMSKGAESTLGFCSPCISLSQLPLVLFFRIPCSDKLRFVSQLLPIVTVLRHS